MSEELKKIMDMADSVKLIAYSYVTHATQERLRYLESNIIPKNQYYPSSDKEFEEDIAYKLSDLGRIMETVMKRAAELKETCNSFQAFRNEQKGGANEQNSEWKSGANT